MRELSFSHPVGEVDTTTLKIPPHSVEAEQSVLGGLMLDSSAWDRVADRVSETDFYRHDHGLIFAAIRGLADTSKPLDVVTVSEALATRDELEQAGGLAYLGELANNTPSAANIGAYADIVRERAVLREMIRAGHDIAEAAFKPEGRTAQDLVDAAERRVFEIAERGSREQGGFQPVKTVVSEVFEFLGELAERGTTLTGVPTGFQDLDDRTSGLQRGDLIIVAGRPSMGKTSLAMNIVENAALGAKLPVAVFSMEMPSTSLVMRMLSSLGRVDQLRVRTGQLDAENWAAMTSTMAMLNEANIHFDDTPALTPTEVRARCRRLAREHPLGLVVIDYLQLMQVPSSRENRATEISEISRSLKALAKELNVPVVALSQLNRSLEQRQDKRPVMSDLRESGAIEQDADVILFVYRDEVYNENSPDKGTAELIIGKQRNGPIGKVKVTFLGHITRFENFAADVRPGGYF